ncbi:type VI secretion system accessory protein TagJ [Mixta tenebrionis]|uniref:Protein of avirulence locus ImpE n=1 Tax=Mixta tenebrionis TaxID=2562439 RepID=A0A506VCR5_9GAMM|nr:type VI secretion system accessory protein TagJ [Mixta tenebrionis]TPW43781.1 protein of avirulence locus ImpE [Mixta tenebrionis]
MNSLNQLLAGRSLDETLAHVEAQIKAAPGDADLRAAFVQLLCLAGNWTRALTQLKPWLALKPQAQPTVTLLEQAIGGELQRAAVFAGQAQPRMPGDAWGWAEQLLAALQADLHGERAQAESLRNAALEAAALNPGSALMQDEEQAQPFAWLADGDSRLGPICEMVVNGHYFWVPFSAIVEMRFQAPVSVTDLVWRHTLVRLVDGNEQVCQLPVRYPFAAGTKDALRLACLTEWQPLDAAQRHYSGQGQKVLLNDKDEFPLLGLETLTFVASDMADA